MKLIKSNIKTAWLLLLISAMTGCDSKPVQEPENNAGNTADAQRQLSEVKLSHQQFTRLDMQVDTIPIKALSQIVEANGQLEVPPQYEATVTAILGANVTSILVIEGEGVRKGQRLAYVAHPGLSNLQTDFIKSYSQLQFLEKEFERQKRLYEENVSSGKTFQQTQAEYHSMRGQVKAYETQLKQLNLNIQRLRDGHIYDQVPVISPIDGYVEKVLIQLGQFVDPPKEMFMIVNTEHVHADLMVFEKDVYKVKEGQKVSFTVESVPGQILTAEIYSVGKQFEKDPKAVHVHAEIHNNEGYLIPGMYINGRIHTSQKQAPALPEEAIIEEAGKKYLFVARRDSTDEDAGWSFRPVEITTGTVIDGWVEVNLPEPMPPGTRVALNNGYYLIAEMKKAERGQGH